VSCAPPASSRIKKALETVKSALLDSTPRVKVLPRATSVPLEPTTQRVAPLSVLLAQVELSLNMKDRYPVNFVRLVPLPPLLLSVLSVPLEHTAERMVRHPVKSVLQDSSVMPRVSSPQLDLALLDITVRKGPPTLNRASALPVTSVLLEVPSLLRVPLGHISLILPLLSVTLVMPALTAPKRDRLPPLDYALLDTSALLVAPPPLPTSPPLDTMHPRDPPVLLPAL